MEWLYGDMSMDEGSAENKPLLEQYFPRLRTTSCQLLDEMHLPFLDLTPMLREANQRALNLTYTADVHWNSLAHRLADKQTCLRITENPGL